jgi:hypothetical protein
MKNTRIWLAAALLIACMTACANSGGTGSSPSPVTPAVSKAVYIAPTVTVYNDSLFTADVSQTYSGGACWSPASAVIDSLDSQKFSPIGDLCSAGTLTVNDSAVVANECLLVWTGFRVLVVNNSNTNCTWDVTGSGAGTLTYMLLMSVRKHGR